MTSFGELSLGCQIPTMLCVTQDPVNTHFLLIISIKQETREKVSSYSPEETQRLGLPGV